MPSYSSAAKIQLLRFADIQIGNSGSTAFFRIDLPAAFFAQYLRPGSRILVSYTPSRNKHRTRCIPKTVLFFFAFLPQFIDVGRGAVVLQVVLLGSILIFLGTLSDSIYALASGSLGNWLRGNLKFLRAQRYFAGSVYIGLGAATALSGTHRR
jgi:hypothetical protein